MKVRINSQNYMDFYNKQKRQNQMTQRRSWSQEQDIALKYLKDTLNVKKWSQISRRLEFQFNLPGRNGKQCRQRYTNHLDSSIILREITLEDQEKLFKLHDRIGNKWSLISKQFTGRTDNHIKNHFHSKLRKGIRKLNKEIKQHYKKSIKPFKLNIIYKIVEGSDYRFSDKVFLDEQNSFDFNQLKNVLLQYAGGIVQKTQLSSLKTKEQALFLVSKLDSFEKQFKNRKLSTKTEKFETNVMNKQKQKKSLKIDSTENSGCSSQMENQFFIEDAQEQDSIYEEGSFQFIVEGAQLNSSYKSMEEETNNSVEEQKPVNGVSSLKQISLDLSSFYSFSNVKKQISDQKGKFGMLPLGLIEEEQFPEIALDRKLSIRSFDSLRQYDDSLNDSQVHLMLKRVDSYSDIQAGLFE